MTNVDVLDDVDKGDSVYAMIGVDEIHYIENSDSVEGVPSCGDVQLMAIV